MRLKLVLAVLLIGVILVSALLVARNRSTGSSTSFTTSTARENTTSAATFARGLTFTPATYGSNGTSDFFVAAKQAGTVVTWAGDWETLGNPQGAPYVLEALAKQNGLSLVVELQFFDSSTGQLLRPLNSTNEAAYQSLAVKFAQAYKPQYIGLGVEVNLLFEHSPADYQRFVQLFNETRSAIRSVSPGTAVFTVFQLERMNGLDGGLFGGANNASRSEWNLLANFTESDLVGFTTYPGLIYHDPSDIPSDYYLSIASHTQKPISFTEIGWQSGALPGWSSNETTQALFVTRFFSLTEGLQKLLVVWSVAYDQNTQPPFDTMGLIYDNGTYKQAWTAWIGFG